LTTGEGNNNEGTTAVSQDAGLLAISDVSPIADDENLHSQISILGEDSESVGGTFPTGAAPLERVRRDIFIRNVILRIYNSTDRLAERIATEAVLQEEGVSREADAPHIYRIFREMITEGYLQYVGDMELERLDIGDEFGPTDEERVQTALDGIQREQSLGSLSPTDMSGNQDTSLSLSTDNQRLSNSNSSPDADDSSVRNASPIDALSQDRKRRKTAEESIQGDSADPRDMDDNMSNPFADDEEESGMEVATRIANLYGRQHGMAEILPAVTDYQICFSIKYLLTQDGSEVRYRTTFPQIVASHVHKPWAEAASGMATHRVVPMITKMISDGDVHYDGDTDVLRWNSFAADATTPTTVDDRVKQELDRNGHIKQELEEAPASTTALDQRVADVLQANAPHTQDDQSMFASSPRLLTSTTTPVTKQEVVDDQRELDQAANRGPNVVAHLQHTNPSTKVEIDPCPVSAAAGVHEPDEMLQDPNLTRDSGRRIFPVAIDADAVPTFDANTCTEKILDVFRETADLLRSEITEDDWRDRQNARIERRQLLEWIAKNKWVGSQGEKRLRCQKDRHDPFRHTQMVLTISMNRLGRPCIHFKEIATLAINSPIYGILELEADDWGVHGLGTNVVVSDFRTFHSPTSGGALSIPDPLYYLNAGDKQLFVGTNWSGHSPYAHGFVTQNDLRSEITPVPHGWMTHLLQLGDWGTVQLIGLFPDFILNYYLHLPRNISVLPVVAQLGGINEVHNPMQQQGVKVRIYADAMSLTFCFFTGNRIPVPVIGGDSNNAGSLYPQTDQQMIENIGSSTIPGSNATDWDSLYGFWRTGRLTSRLWKNVSPTCGHDIRRYDDDRFFRLLTSFGTQPTPRHPRGDSGYRSYDNKRVAVIWSRSADYIPGVRPALQVTFLGPEEMGMQPQMRMV